MNEVEEKDVTTMLYCEELDKYYHSVYDFLESEDCWTYDDDITRLWVTTKTHLTFDAYTILEYPVEDLYEDCIQNINVAELQFILDAYSEKYKSLTTTYHPDYKEYVVIDYNK